MVRSQIPLLRKTGGSRWWIEAILVSVLLSFTSVAWAGPTEDLLFKGALFGDLKSVQWALSHGANVNVKRTVYDSTGQPVTGQTPLMLAILNGHTQIVKLLLIHHADTNIRNGTGTPAIFYAIGGEDPQIIKLLLDYGADVNIRMSGEFTPLMDAAQEGDTQTVKIFLAHGADVNLVDDNGKTALIEAADAESLPIVKLLCNHHADVNVKDRNGYTAADYARIHGDFNTAILIEKYAR